MILDAGALVAVERNDRRVVARILAAHRVGDEVRTHPMVVAQAWRASSGAQAQLARLLRGVDIVPISADLGRRCGELLGKAKQSDPIDAAVVLIARDGDSILTSDLPDIRALVAADGRPITVLPC